jgi:hypothetical protein
MAAMVAAEGSTQSGAAEEATPVEAHWTFGATGAAGDVVAGATPFDDAGKGERARSGLGLCAAGSDRAW